MDRSSDFAAFPSTSFTVRRAPVGQQGGARAGRRGCLERGVAGESLIGELGWRVPTSTQTVLANRGLANGLRYAVSGATVQGGATGKPRTRKSAHHPVRGRSWTDHFQHEFRATTVRIQVEFRLVDQASPALGLQVSPRRAHVGVGHYGADDE